MSESRWIKGVVVVAVLGALAAAAWLPTACSSDRRFDAALWKAAAGGKSQDRSALVHDLLDSDVLRGKTRSEVLELLGPDDTRSGTGFGAGYFAAWDSVYWVGRDRGIGIDSEWLVLRFGPSGLVTEARTVED